MKELINKYKSISKPARASIWFLVCGFLQRGISVIVTPVFTRLMSTEEYGQYTLFNSWLELLGILLTLRLYYGVFMQGLVRYDDDKDQYTSSLQGLTSVIEIIGLCIYLPFADFWNNLTSLNTCLTICIFVSSWASAMFGFWSTRQRVEYNYRALVALTLIVSLLQPISGIISVITFQESKVEARVVSMCVTQVILFGWIAVYYIAKSKMFYNRRFWAHALKFNIPLIPHYLSHSALNQSDRIMINRMISSTAAGIYGLAYSLSWIMNIVNQALLNTLNPWIYKQIRDKNYHMINKVSNLAMIGVCVANLILIALAPEIVAVFAPSSYQEGIWIVPPLAATVAIMFMYSLFADFEFYYERTDYVMIASVVGAVINIVLNLILLPKYGYIAAAYTTLIGYGVYVGLHYMFMRKVQKQEMNGVRVYNPISLLTILIIFAICVVVLMMLYPTPIFRYLLVSILIIYIYIRRKKLIELYRSVL